MEPLLLRPVAVVRSPRTDVRDDFWGNVVSTIQLDPGQFSLDALQGLDEFSHIVVVFHFNQISEDGALRGAAHPRGNPNWPKVGIFAQRKKDRPNRLGVSVCELLAVNGLVLTVKALDAIDGTPVLDIKPHVREFVPEAATVRQPQWQTELMESYYK